MTGTIQLTAGPSPLWYATRAGGTVALLLLTATVVLGIVAGGRYAPRRVARFEIGALHRNISLLALAFLALHIVTAIADTFVHLTWLDALVPFASSYRPLWLGLGTLAFDLLLAVLVTSAVRLRIGQRRWKTVHWLAYACWPLAVFHGAGTGTDTRLSLQLALYAGCLALVVVAVLAVFLAAGPLKPGWAHRAGDAPQAVLPAASDRGASTGQTGDTE